MAGVRKLRSGTWQGWYQHYEGRRAFFTLTHTATRREVLAAAQALDVQHAQIRLGVLPRPDQQNVALARPIEDVIAEYVVWGQHQGGHQGRPWAPPHDETRRKQLTWWQERLHLVTLGDCLGILPRVERVIQACAEEGMSGQTAKHYRHALTGFCAWCTRRAYLPTDPLQYLGPLHAAPKTTRRALTHEESRRLLAQCAPAHYLLYATALLTGLRANELRQLSMDHLDIDHGGLRLDAAWTKNRQPGWQPLPGELVAALYTSVRAGEPMDRYSKARRQYALPAQPLLFVPDGTGRLIDADLQRVGIPKHTSKGKIDFHALRTTSINLMFAQGATVPEAQALARHRTAALTVGVYGRAHDERLEALVEGVAATILPTRVRAPGVHAQAIGGEKSQHAQSVTALSAQPGGLAAQ